MAGPMAQGGGLCSSQMPCWVGTAHSARASIATRLQNKASSARIQQRLSMQARAHPVAWKKLGRYSDGTGRQDNCDQKECIVAHGGLANHFRVLDPHLPAHVAMPFKGLDHTEV